MGNESSVHFRCSLCNKDRDFKRELSHLSREALTHAPGNMPQKERKKLLYCKWCINEALTHRRDLPKEIVKWLGDKAYWEGRVRPEELISPHGGPEPVEHDRLLTFEEACHISGMPMTTVTSWADHKRVETYIPKGEKKRLIKMNSLLKLLEARAMKANPLPTLAQTTGVKTPKTMKPATAPATAAPEKRETKVAKAGRPKGKGMKVRTQSYIKVYAEALNMKVDAEGRNLMSLAEDVDLSFSQLYRVSKGQMKYFQHATIQELDKLLGSYVQKAEKRIQDRRRNGGGKKASPAPVETNGSAKPEKVIVINPVVPEEALGSLPPWEVEKVRTALERLSGIEDRLTAVELKLGVYEAWVDRQKGVAPTWPGWTELDNDLEAVEQAASVGGE